MELPVEPILEKFPYAPKTFVAVTLFETTKFAKGWVNPEPDHTSPVPDCVRTCPAVPILDAESTIPTARIYPATSRR